MLNSVLPRSSRGQQTHIEPQRLMLRLSDVCNMYIVHTYIHTYIQPASQPARQTDRQTCSQHSGSRISIIIIVLPFCTIASSSGLRVTAFWEVVGSFDILTKEPIFPLYTKEPIKAGLRECAVEYNIPG